MQQSGGLLLARARPSETIIFAKGKNENQIPISSVAKHFCTKYGFFWMDSILKMTNALCYNAYRTKVGNDPVV